MRCLMNRHFYLIFVQTLSLFLVWELSAQVSDITASNNLLVQEASETITQEQVGQIETMLPLSPLVFAQEVNLRDKLTPLLLYLAHHEPKKLSSDVYDYLNRTAALEMIVASYLLVLTLKSIIHCQISQPVPKRLRYSSLDMHESTATTSQDWVINDVEQKISIAEIIDLLEHVQEDLAHIDELHRHDKKEIMNILLNRQQQLERKLKQLGILHYSSQSSFWDSSLATALAGMCLGMTIITLALASINTHEAQPTLQFPSTTLLINNLGLNE